VTQFLADAHPSHLLKASTDEGGPLQRARINFFVDTYFSKVNGLYFAAAKLEAGAEKEEAAGKYVDAVVKEIEPLLADAAPYFGGSSKLTLAEVIRPPTKIEILANFSRSILLLLLSVFFRLLRTEKCFRRASSRGLRRRPLTSGSGPVI